MRTMIRIIAVAALLFAATGAFAESGDTLNIGGQVALKLNLSVTGDTNADNLALFSDPQVLGVDANIAAISITTNNTSGWELWVFSENAAGATTTLENADTDTIDYTISYSGTGGVTAIDIPDIGLAVGQNTSAPLAGTPETGTLSIRYDSDAYPAGYYSDQLAIVLRAK